MLFEHTLIEIVRIERRLEGLAGQFLLKSYQGATGMGGMLSPWTMMSAWDMEHRSVLARLLPDGLGAGAGNTKPLRTGWPFRPQ